MRKLLILTVLLAGCVTATPRKLAKHAPIEKYQSMLVAYMAISHRLAEEIKKKDETIKGQEELIQWYFEQQQKSIKLERKIMIIKADKEAINIITQLCDVALKNGGLQNFNVVGNVMRSIEQIKPEKKQKPTEPEPDKKQVHKKKDKG